MVIDNDLMAHSINHIRFPISFPLLSQPLSDWSETGSVYQMFGLRRGGGTRKHALRTCSAEPNIYRNVGQICPVIHATPLAACLSVCLSVCRDDSTTALSVTNFVGLQSNMVKPQLRLVFVSWNTVSTATQHGYLLLADVMSTRTHTQTQTEAGRQTKREIEGGRKRWWSASEMPAAVAGWDNRCGSEVTSSYTPSTNSRPPWPAIRHSRAVIRTDLQLHKESLQWAALLYSLLWAGLVRVAIECVSVRRDVAKHEHSEFKPI